MENKIAFYSDAVYASIELLKCVPTSAVEQDNKYSFMDCVEYGFIFVYKDSSGYMIQRNVSSLSFNAAHNIYFTNYNNTLFSKQQAITMDDNEYYFHQILHYLTTYGADAVGVKCPAYIPVHSKDNETISKDLIVIEVVGDTIWESDIINYLTRTKKINNNNLSKVLDFISYISQNVSIALEDFSSLEVMSLYAEWNNIVPQNIEVGIRLLVYIFTSKPFIIKNRETINDILNSQKKIDDKFVKKLFFSYEEKDYATIFYRYKPILLAFKQIGDKKVKYFINRVRRLANDYNKPMRRIGVQYFFEQPKAVQELYIKEMNNRQLIKLMNFVTMRNSFNNHQETYFIRNGKTYTKETNKSLDTYSFYKLLGELRSRFAALQNKYVILPKDIEYTVPVSEKQFIGVFPWGSYINLPQEEALIGISWNNFKGETTDLDFHIINDNAHYGWNGERTGNVTYSGDMTDATNGATEKYWIREIQQDYALQVRPFSKEHGEMDFHFFTNHKDSVQKVVDLPLKINDAGIGVGILSTTGKLYLSSFRLDSQKIPKGKQDDFISGLINRWGTSGTVKQLLDAVGAEVVHSEEEVPIGEQYFDLRLGALNTTTLLDFVDGNFDLLPQGKREE